MKSGWSAFHEKNGIFFAGIKLREVQRVLVIFVRLLVVAIVFVNKVADGDTACHACCTGCD